MLDKAARWAWLITFLVFLLSAGGWRAVPFLYVPTPAVPDGQASGKARPLEPAVVLPFDELLVASPNAIVHEEPSEAPQPLRREKTDRGPALVCELGADSNHLGRVDGKALARALAAELSGSGLFRGDVSYVESLEELRERTVVIQGKVLEASLSILKNGEREYAVGVALTASRASSGYLPPSRAFWHRTLHRKARSAGAPAAYEISALVRALYADAAEKLGEADWDEPALP